MKHKNNLLLLAVVILCSMLTRELRGQTFFGSTDFANK